MKVRYFVRVPKAAPVFAQDHPTYIMLGRWCHMYVPRYGDWFIVNPAPLDPKLLNRPDTRIDEITFEEMLQKCGPRLLLEIREDHYGVRLKNICRTLSKIPFVGRIPWVHRYAHLDEEDNPRWYYERQFPTQGLILAKANPDPTGDDTARSVLPRPEADPK